MTTAKRMIMNNKNGLLCFTLFIDNYVVSMFGFRKEEIRIGENRRKRSASRLL